MENEKRTLKEKWNDFWYEHGDTISTGLVLLGSMTAVAVTYFITGAVAGQEGLKESMASVDPEAFKEMMKKLGEKDAEEIIQKIAEKASEEK